MNNEFQTAMIYTSDHRTVKLLVFKYQFKREILISYGIEMLNIKHFLHVICVSYNMVSKSTCLWYKITICTMRPSSTGELVTYQT
jgi:hypothetical protein